MTLEVVVPAYHVDTVVGDDGADYTRLSVAGFDAGDRPGFPDLPAKSILLAAPPGAGLAVEVEVVSESRGRLAYPVYPVAALTPNAPVDPATGKPDLTRATGLNEVFARDAAAYRSLGAYPATLATIEEAGYVRDVRLARLTIYPLQYTPATAELRHISYMRVRVSFAGAAPTPPAAARPDVGGFDALIAQVVANPAQAALWRANPPTPEVAAVGLPLDAVRYRITLRETGIYRLGYADLLAAGVPLTGLDPRTLQVYEGDNELAVEVTGEADGRFDPGDVIRFYARSVRSFYTDANTLWLVVGRAAGRRMTTRDVSPTNDTPADSFPHTQRFEQDRIYRSIMPAASGVDHWYWGQTYVLSRGSVLTFTAAFTVENPLSTGAVSLTLDLWGGSADPRVVPDHHSRIYINGVLVGDVYFSGAVQALAAFTFDQSLLQLGGNTLTLYTPGDTGARDYTNQPWENTWLNHFTLTYRRSFDAMHDRLAFTPDPGPGIFSLTGWSSPDVLLYDVSDPLTPVRLIGGAVGRTDARYALRVTDAAPAGAYYAAGGTAVRSPPGLAADQPSGLRSPAAGADLLIIAHADFLAGVQALAQLRRSQGLRVQVIDVQDIYDEFSGGLLDPHAIRAFLQHAYFHWPPPAAAYVLLVGSGTYDFLNNEGYGKRTFIPPFLAYVDPVLGETAADNRYVAVVGDDAMPDMHLGRFPVTSLAELTAMVDKTIAYETNPAPGAWRMRAVFVADNPDNAGYFDQLSDVVADHLPPEFVAHKIYLGTAAYPVSQATRAQQATLDAFNQGALLFNYVGHSSISNWAGEFLFGVNTLPQVANGSFYPIMLPMTCLEL